MGSKKIAVLGAGIAGLWQAYELARRGHDICLIERTKQPFKQSASWIAGAMLAPFCEAEADEPLVREFGLKAIGIWRRVFPGIVENGSLVLALARDQGELVRFANLTEMYEKVDAKQIAELEPEIAGRFSSGLFYAQEAHLQPHWAMTKMLELVQQAGAQVSFGEASVPAGSDVLIDCRGIAAADELPSLRGVRGEMVIIRTRELTLHRPVRLLHPRYPIYIVPWPEGHYMVGATMIEAQHNSSNASLRSALELLGSAYALHPAFGEAEIINIRASVRPAFADNLPKIIVHGSRLYVNGFYRHGFLLAPIIAEMVGEYIDDGKIVDGVFVADNC
jgi:glycine oxidase